MKPNVILINCDDLGYGDLGCYGSELNDTPFIDNLAKEGVKFNSFYASSPICTPSRASLMTGCFAQRVELPKVLFPAASVGLNNNEFTMPKLFKNAGYNTMIIGKWHCGDNKETLPCKFGFDDYYGLPYSNDMGRQKNGLARNTKNPNSYRPPLPLIHGDEVIEEQPDQTGITERYTEKSIEFIRKNANKPFFLYLAHMHVHLPLYEQQSFLNSSRNGDFGACVASIDCSTHCIVHELKKLNIYEDTLIIFTSDNGSLALNGASNYPLRGRKTESYEGGFRVPFIVHWKGHLPEGKEINNMASNKDLLPTFESLLNQPLSSNKIDGVNILPMLFGDDNQIRTEFPYYSVYNLMGIRKNNYKLLVANKKFQTPNNIIFDSPELYDVEKDVSETTDISKDNKPIVNELLSLMEKYRKELGDDLQGVKGTEIRPCTKIADPVPLTEYNENHPYIISMYDKDDRG